MAVPPLAGAARVSTSGTPSPGYASIDEVPDATPPPAAGFASIDEVPEGAPPPTTPPAPGFASVEEIPDATPPATPAPGDRLSLGDQARLGTAVPAPVPTDADIGGLQGKAYQLLYDQAKGAGASDAEANADARDSVEAAYRSVDRNDASRLFLGPEDRALDAAANAAGGYATPEGAILKAVGPHYYGENGRADAPPWVLARTDGEKRDAMSYRIASLLNRGLSGDDARKQAAAEAAQGLLFLENPASARRPSAEQVAPPKVVPEAINTPIQAVADLERGVSSDVTDVANATKDLTDLTVVAPVRMALEHVPGKGAVATGARTLDRWAKAYEDWTIPSMFDVAAAHLPAWSLPAFAREAAQNAVARDAGLGIGTVEAVNAADALAPSGGLPSPLPGGPRLTTEPLDPTSTEGVGNRIAHTLAASTRPNPDAPDRDAVDVINAAEAGFGAAGQTVERERARGTAFQEGRAIPGASDASEADLATVSGAFTGPVMDTFQAATHGPQGRETVIGQTLRVLGSGLAGMVTTYLGRLADYGLTQAGATSYRTGRTPTAEMDHAHSWPEALLSPLGAPYWYDYATTVDNGDALTTEVLRATDTYALGMPGLTPEQRAPWLPGGVARADAAQLGMWGDLLIPMDKVPRAIRGATVGRASRFVRGMKAATDAGIGWRDAMPVGGAQAAPWLTHQLLKNDPIYRAGTDAFSAAQDAAATATAQTTGAPTPTVRTNDVDPTAVTVATLYRWARNQGERGRTLADWPSGSLPYREHQTVDQVREVLSRLGLTPAVVDRVAGEAAPTPAPSFDPRTVRPTTRRGLLSLGYTTDQIATMTEGEARQRIDEGVRPGERPEFLPETPLPREDVVAALGVLHRVAQQEGKPPIGTWPKEVAALPDPVARSGAQLSALAAHLGVAADSVYPRLVLQAALSFDRPDTGVPFRAPVLTDAVLDRVKPSALASALDRLRRSSPETIWKATLDFENGEPHWFADDLAVEAEANRTSRGLALPAEQRGVLGALPEGSRLREVVTREGAPTEAKNVAQKVAATAVPWIVRAQEALASVARARKEALRAAQEAWFAVAKHTGRDPLLPPEIGYGEAIRGVDPTPLPGPLAKKVARAVAGVDKADAAFTRAGDRLRAMVALADAHLAETWPSTHGSPRTNLPGRARTRQALRAMVRDGRAAFTNADVDAYLTIFDRVAKALTDAKAIPSPDHWWRSLAWEGLEGADPAVAGQVDFAGFAETGRALVQLARTADLSTLAHESAHVLRRLLPPDVMRVVDDAVRERFGGWTKEAEEWFAEQFEAVLRTGSLVEHVTEPTKVPALTRLNRALRLAARVLADVYTKFRGATIDPTFHSWIKDFLKLDADRKLSEVEPVGQAAAPEAGEPLALPTREPETLRPTDRNAERAARAGAEAGAAGLAPNFIQALRDVREGKEAPPPPELPTRPPRVVAAAPEAPATVPAPGAAHSPYFDANRPGLMRRLGAVAKRHGIALPYRVFAPWAEAKGWGRPSAWDAATWDARLAELEKDAGLRAEAGSAPEPPPSPQQALPTSSPSESPAPAASQEAPPPAAEPAAEPVAEPAEPASVLPAVDDAADYLVAAIREGAAPATRMARKREFLAALGAGLHEVEGTPVPAGRAERLVRVPADLRHPVEEAIAQATKLAGKANAKARAEIVQRAVDDVRSRAFPDRETPAPLPPAPVRDAFAPDAVPAPPPTNLTAEQAARPVGAAGNAYVNAIGDRRRVVDSQKTWYDVDLDVVPIDSLVTSHTDTGLERPEYDQRLQNRKNAQAREDTTEQRSRNLVPQFFDPNDTTLVNGPPTVWVNDQGRPLVVAGNGRTWSILRALQRNDVNAAAYRHYAQRWALALGLPLPGPHDILIRRVRIDPDDIDQAIVLAQNSQRGPSEPEADADVIVGFADVARATRPLDAPIDLSTLPTSFDVEVCRTLLRENRAVGDALKAMVPEQASREAIIAKNDQNALVNRIKGVVLAQFDATTIRDAARAGMLNVLVNAAPGMAALHTLAAERPRWGVADVAAYFGDALALADKARALTKTSPKGVAGIAQALVEQIPVTAAAPIPVSRPSVALAMHLLTIGADEDRATNFAVKLRELHAAIARSGQGGLGFGFSEVVKDPEAIVVGAFASQKEQAAALPKELPGDHAAAIARARDLQMAAIEAREASVNATDPPPETTRAAGVVDASTKTDPDDVLQQHRAYVGAVSGGVEAAGTGAAPGTAARTVVRDETLKDEPSFGYAANQASNAPKDTKGYLYQTARGLPELDRRQLNTVLGYAPDQRAYDAVDVQARAFAYVVAHHLQAGQARRWRRIGLVTAVPPERVAAVRQRVATLLGSLPGEVIAAQRASRSDGRAPVGLALPTAQRLTVLLRYLDTSGHGEALPLGLTTRTPAELAQTVSLNEWNEIVMAAHDAMAGAVPYRGRVENYGMAASWLWSLTQRYGGLLVPEPTTRGASAARVALNGLRRDLGTAVLAVGTFFLPYEEFQPQMASWVRPHWERAHREMGSEPAAVMDRLERAMVSSGRSPTAVPDALRGLTQEPAFRPIVGVATPLDSASDLNQLRGWLYRDTAPDPSGAKHGRPYAGLHGQMATEVQARYARELTRGAAPDVAAQRAARNAQWTAHDLPLDPGEAPTLADVYARADLVERVLLGTDGVTGDRLAIVDRLRRRVLTDDDVAIVVTHLYDVLNACKARGRDLLASAAGYSGREHVDRNLPAHPGMELDAYEAWHQGRWAAPRDGGAATPGNGPYAVPLPDGSATVVNSSIERLVQLLNVGNPVPTAKWVTESVIRGNVRAIRDRFVRDLIDRQFVRDLRTVYRDAHPDAPEPDLVTAHAFGHKVAEGLRAIIETGDVTMSGGMAADGTVHPGIALAVSMTPEERYAAKTLATRLGLFQDAAIERKGLKGSLTPTPSIATIGTAPTRGDLATRLLADPAAFAQDRGGALSLPQGDVLLPDTFVQELRASMDRYAPVGRYLGSILTNERGRTSPIGRGYREWYKLLKGGLVSGGPNGWVATALALGVAGHDLAAGDVSSLQGIAQTGMAFAGGLYLTSLPRLQGFANNVLTMIMPGGQAWLGGAWAGLGAHLPSAFRVTAETVRFRWTGGMFATAERLLQAVATRAQGDMDAVAVVTPDGRVLTYRMLADISQRYGLDGTQARFESEEEIDRRLVRLEQQFAPTTFTGRAWGLVKSLYGRNVLAENYRKFYEALDSGFRHALLAHGLKQGLTADEAVNRALLLSFDYGQSSPADRVVNRAFTFWMYTRRAIDLSIYTLLTEPHRILGPLRFAKDQQVVAEEQEHHEGKGGLLDADYQWQGENLPEWAQGSIALGRYPVAGASNKALQLLLPEPVSGTATRFLADLGTGDALGMAGRARPELQFGTNAVLYKVGGGFYVDFRAKRNILDDPDANVVPPAVVRADQHLFGGALAAILGIQAAYEPDPAKRATPGTPVRWVIPDPRNQLMWQFYRTFLPGAATGIETMDTADRASLPPDIVGNALYDALERWDADNTLLLRQRMSGDRNFYPAPDAGPRPAYGDALEGAKTAGLRVVPTATDAAVKVQPRRATARTLQAVTQKPFNPNPPVTTKPTAIPLETANPSPPDAVTIPNRQGIEGG